MGTRLLCMFALMFSITSTGLANECREFGTPSYSAVRTTQIGPKTIVSKVFVIGDKEREEASFADRIVVHIRTADALTTFDEATNTGVRVKVIPARPPVDKGDPNMRLVKSREGDSETIAIQVREGGAWNDLIKVTCRLDGVLLEREYPTVLPGAKRGRIKVVQTEIQLEALSPALLEVPKHVKIKDK